MGNYENGLETRNKILEVCKRLFYEKGFEETTYAMISEETQINQGSIYYHFKTKDSIATEISDQNIANLQKIAFRLTQDGENNGIVTYILVNYLTRYRSFTDRKYGYFDLMTGTIHYAVYKNPWDYYRKVFGVFGFDKYIGDLKNDFELIMVACIGMDKEVSVFYYKNAHKFHFMQIVDFYIRTSFDMLKIDKDLYEEAFVRAKEIFSELKIKGNGFDTSVRRMKKKTN